MKYLDQEQNHLQIAKNYLLEQYKNRPTIDALTTALIGPLQEIENRLYFLYENYHLTVATGCFLDRIGAIIGEARNYREDDEYKLSILIRIIANNGGGTAEEILIILQNIYPINCIEYFECGTAYFQIYIESTCKPTAINDLLKQLKPAGVNLPIVVYSGSSNVFRFSENSKTNDLLMLKTSLGTSTMSVQGGGEAEHEMAIIFDDFEAPTESLGFAEIVVHKFDIELDDQSNYLVDENTTLETIMSYKDFSIKGGSKFAEILKNA